MGAPDQSVWTPVRSQTVAVGASSAAVTNAFGTGIFVLRIASTAALHYAVGASPTATSSDAYLPANTVEYIAVRPGQKIAVIQDSSSGNATVTEMSP